LRPAVIGDALVEELLPHKRGVAIARVTSKSQQSSRFCKE